MAAVCSSYGCTNAASALACPICISNGITSSVFCDQQCFNESWARHKGLHKTLRLRRGKRANRKVPQTRTHGACQFDLTINLVSLHSLSWPDRVFAQRVCREWRSAIGGLNLLLIQLPKNEYSLSTDYTDEILDAGYTQAQCTEALSELVQVSELVSRLRPEGILQKRLAIEVDDLQDELLTQQCIAATRLQRLAVRGSTIVALADQSAEATITICREICGRTVHKHCGVSHALVKQPSQHARVLQIEQKISHPEFEDTIHTLLYFSAEKPICFEVPNHSSMFSIKSNLDDECPSRQCPVGNCFSGTETFSCGIADMGKHGYALDSESRKNTLLSFLAHEFDNRSVFGGRCESESKHPQILHEGTLWDAQEDEGMFVQLCRHGHLSMRFATFDQEEGILFEHDESDEESSGDYDESDVESDEEY